MLVTQSEYLPLEDHDPCSSSEEIAKPYVGDSNERWVSLISRFTYLATMIVVVCTVVDVLVLIRFGGQLYYPPQVVTPNPVGRTELRSSYVNLDVLYSKGNITSSQHAPIVNHALSFAQVSLAEPERVLPTYQSGYVEEQFGLVPRVARRLLVTPQISTVAQFRAIDFGMESCALAIGVPAFDETETDGPVMSSPSFVLDVHTLPIRERLYPNTVSYTSLPGTKSLFAQLVLSESTVVQTPVFPCRTLSYHTFYLSCSDPDCHLDLIGTTSGELGLFMYQYQTI